MEHADTLPAASVAVAVNDVVLLASTVATYEKLVLLKGPTVPTAVPEQFAEAKIRTVEPFSAVPFKVGVVLLFDGDVGVVPVSTGAAGAVLSETYTRAVEHPELLFAASVARA